MTVMTASQRGKRNRDVGAETERRFAAYLRPLGWPHADRKVNNGWKAGGRESRDCGDIKGTPGLVFQLKRAKAGMTDLEITRALQDAQDQAVAASADLGVLVQRRTGKADPGQWWAYITVWDLHALVVGEQRPPVPPGREFTAPVRLLVSDLIPLLHAAGYGMTPKSAE